MEGSKDGGQALSQNVNPAACVRSPDDAIGRAARRVSANLFSLGDLIADPVTGHRMTVAEKHRLAVDSAVRAEQAGFDGISIGEHHAMEYVYSSPPVILAAIAERTTALRLATAVTLLANLDPVRVAEDYATLDVLSGGRVEVVAGRGDTFGTTYSLFGHELAESRERFEEAVRLLLQLWGREEVQWKGRFRPPIDGRRVQPGPVQEPPVVWLGGTSPETVALAAQFDLGLMLPCSFADPAKYREVVQSFRAQHAEHGHAAAPRVGGCWHVSVGRSAEDARRRWEPRYAAYHAWHREIISRSNPGGPPRPHQPFDLDELMAHGPAVMGSAEQVVERLRDRQETLGLTDHLLYMDMGGMPRDELMDEIDLAGREVLPALA